MFADNLKVDILMAEEVIAVDVYVPYVMQNYIIYHNLKTELFTNHIIDISSIVFIESVLLLSTHSHGPC